ncbi:hypothetical protein J1614_012193 [Plenodomus biglobosus]|nr:hypothetical protein J1614_012193 [Plenodomus biglobosus]
MAQVLWPNFDFRLWDSSLLNHIVEGYHHDIVRMAVYGTVIHVCLVELAGSREEQLTDRGQGDMLARKLVVLLMVSVSVFDL